MERPQATTQIQNPAIAHELALMEDGYRSIINQNRELGLVDSAELVERQMGGVMLRAQARLEHPIPDIDTRHSLRPSRSKGIGRLAKGRQIV